MLANSPETVHNLRHLHLDRSAGTAGSAGAGGGDHFGVCFARSPGRDYTCGSWGTCGECRRVVGRDNHAADLTTRGERFGGLTGRWTISAYQPFRDVEGAAC